MIQKLIGTMVRMARSSVRKNAFGIRRLAVPYLRLLRHAKPRSLSLKGKTIEIVDPYWAVNDFVEIFWDEIYHFKPRRDRPMILDCGSNVGLSVIYFKLAYPASRVTAFEPDPRIFGIMKRNIQRFALNDVMAINKAVWIDESSMTFLPDGGVAGRLVSDSAAGETVPVETVRLADYLQQPVDLLKLDIEGAEYDVLRDCRGYLKNVDHLFVEFHGDPHQKQNLQDVLSLLTDSGFRYYLLEARRERRPLDFDWRWQFYDVQMNIFAVRE
jgi:FkbM family methyltransferase